MEFYIFSKPMANIVHNQALFISRKDKDGCCHFVCYFGISALELNKSKEGRHSGKQYKSETIWVWHCCISTNLKEWVHRTYNIEKHLGLMKMSHWMCVIEENV